MTARVSPPNKREKSATEPGSRIQPVRILCPTFQAAVRHADDETTGPIDANGIVGPGGRPRFGCRASQRVPL
jgi:hypothetical protein